VLVFLLSYSCLHRCNFIRETPGCRIIVLFFVQCVIYSCAQMQQQLKSPRRVLLLKLRMQLHKLRMQLHKLRMQLLRYLIIISYVLNRAFSTMAISSHISSFVVVVVIECIQFPQITPAPLSLIDDKVNLHYHANFALG